MFNYANITAYRREMRHEPDDDMNFGEGAVSRRELLIRTAAHGKRQSCGRAFRSSIRTQMEKGEPNDSTNFGSHANPGIGSHFGQTKFLAFHSASPKIKRLRSGLVAHLYGRK